jgi:type III pantothenate kinase
MVWLSLIIGNSRLHWAWWQAEQLQATWHSPHGGPTDRLENLPPALTDRLAVSSWQELPFYWASVVPELSAQWRSQGQEIVLDAVPLQNMYPTLGIDRALAAYGAGEKYGYPVLAIDGGTAITLTGVDANKQLVGGAIWPGLSLQSNSLATGTGQLPFSSASTSSRPERWSRDTPGAIRSGIWYSTGAGLRDFSSDWQQRFPHSSIVVTGGDGQLLARLLATADLKHQVTYDPNLAWWGLGLVTAKFRANLKREKSI